MEVHAEASLVLSTHLHTWCVTGTETTCITGSFACHEKVFLEDMGIVGLHDCFKPNQDCGGFFLIFIIA